MSSVGELVDATLNRWLVGTYRSKTNVLDQDIDDATDTIECKFPPPTVGDGTLIAIDDELMEVTRTPQQQTLQVIRGVRGTNAADHTVPATIEINPRYPRLSVRAAMLDEIVSWPETLFAVTAVDMSPTSGTLDLSGQLTGRAVRRVLAVWRDGTSTSDDRWRPADWTSAKDARGPGTCDIYLDNVQALSTTARNYRVVVGTEFDTTDFDDGVDLQATVGVPRSAEDVLQLGIAYRLVTGREAKRLYTEAQGESRDATEMGSLDIARFGIQLMQMRDSGIAREAKRLKDRYGVGITGG